MHHDSSEKIREYLRKQAPFSVIDKGIGYAQNGGVAECSRTGSRISGTVTDDQEQLYSIHLDILSGNALSATCTCSSQEEMDE